MKYANFVVYLGALKEDQIMKKVILDMCFLEETFKITGTELSIFEIDRKSSLYKKIKELIIG